MPPITATIEVDRPAEGVFAYVTNPSRCRKNVLTSLACMAWAEFRSSFGRMVTRLIVVWAWLRVSRGDRRVAAQADRWGA